MATHNDSYQALLRDAVRQIQELKAELAAQEAQKKEPIAIIGMACRFPRADTLGAYWDLLASGGDAIGPIPPERWDVDAYCTEAANGDRKIYTQQMGAIEQAYAFDSKFFKISPRVAETIDPQQRLLLEVTWEALEHAGIAPDMLRLSPTGVFIGLAANDFALHCAQMSADPDTILGGSHGIAAGRIAYILGLQGPVLHLDTTCSSSLVALHLACQSLRSGDCNLALVGGAHLVLSPLSMVGLCHIKALAPDGRCKTFDAAADGFGRGEGCGVVVLKRYDDARKDNDRILALVRGSALNHDGPSSRLTAPNQQAQEKVLKQALHNARLEPEAISYIEAHGTGTPLGDPVELNALHKVYGQRTTPLWVGSVKTNIGHLEAAAGVAGLIKVVLALQHGVIPPHLHFHNPTPHFDWQATPIQMPTLPVPWKRNQAAFENQPGLGQRCAGISSFGFSGTNAHVILQEAPSPANPCPAQERPWHLLTLSAKSDSALAALVARYGDFLATRVQSDLGDICYTANVGRTHFPHRLCVIAQSLEEMRAKLDVYVKEGTQADVMAGRVPEYQPTPTVAFLFTPHSTQNMGLGRALYQTQPTFRQAFDRCDALAQRYQPHSFFTQFALMYALAELWQAWGVNPDFVLGEGIGEIVAACTAEVFGVEQGVQLLAAALGLTSQPFRQVVESIPYAPPRLPLLSSFNGVSNQAGGATADYWMRYQDLRAHAYDLTTLRSQKIDIFLEMGPPSRFGEKLKRFFEQSGEIEAIKSSRSGRQSALLSLAPQPPTPLLLACLEQGGDDWPSMLVCFAALYCRGVSINWAGFERDYPRRKVTLPTYPFQRQSYWVTPAAQSVLAGDRVTR